MTTWILLHGAGSTPEFVRRTFGPAAERAGATLQAPDMAGATMADMVETIAQCAPGPTDLIGGVSLGAHAAAAFAADTGWSGRLYAVMPAWVGPPEQVAALTARTADQVETIGVEDTLADIASAAAPGDWIYAELHRAWRAMSRETLVRALRVAAVQSAPTAQTLSRVRGRARIVALADDPTHPLAVARVWAESIAHAQLHVLDRDLGGADTTELASRLQSFRAEA